MSPGDLLFYPTTPKSPIKERLIAAIELLLGQGSADTQYCHVAVATAPGFLCEATAPVSRRRAIDPSEAVEIWRPAAACYVNGEQVALWAEAHVGEKYDAGRLFFGLFKSRNRNICSTFAAEAWASQGFDIRQGSGRWVTPNDLIASGVLRRIA